MDSTLHDFAFNNDDDWWIAGRRTIFVDVLKSNCIDSDALIVDVGTSSGTNLRALRESNFRNHLGIELNFSVAKKSTALRQALILNGDAIRLPLKTNGVDVALATDVIEHIPDDRSALKEIHRILDDEGVALITVPAFKVLWSKHDELNGHLRRYRKRQLTALLQDCDFEVVHTWYFNQFSFFPALVMRLVGRGRGLGRQRANTPSRIDSALLRYFVIEERFARRVPFPFGVSLAAICKKSGRPLSPVVLEP